MWRKGSTGKPVLSIYLLRRHVHRDVSLLFKPTKPKEQEDEIE